jgi:hypothetical protein
MCGSPTCRYAHGYPELRTRNDHKNWKRKRCRYFWGARSDEGTAALDSGKTKHYCVYGIKCTRRHDEQTIHYDEHKIYWLSRYDKTVREVWVDEPSEDEERSIRGVLTLPILFFENLSMYSQANYEMLPTHQIVATKIKLFLATAKLEGPLQHSPHSLDALHSPAALQVATLETTLATTSIAPTTCSESAESATTTQEQSAETVNSPLEQPESPEAGFQIVSSISPPGDPTSWKQHAKPYYAPALGARNWNPYVACYPTPYGYTYVEGYVVNDVFYPLLPAGRGGGNWGPYGFAPSNGIYNN